MHDLPTITPYQVFKSRRQILKDPLPFHREKFEKHGDFFRIKPPFGKAVLFTRDAQLTQHVLQKGHRKYDKSPLQTRSMAKYLGRGILTSGGEHWRTHRRMVQPAFHRKKLQSLIGIMETAIRAELERIVPRETRDIYPLMGDLAFQVVANSLFSRPDIRDRMEVLKDITERNQHMLIREMRQPYLKWWFYLSGAIQRHLRLAEKSRGILNTIIEQRLGSGEEKDDLLDLLLAARYEDGTPMSRNQLIDEVLILFSAGYETTANALCFTLFLLARHPHVQQRVCAEADQFRDHPSGLLGRGGKSYIQCCIEEAMRLYPPVYVIDRVALEDDTIGERHIPKGTLILMSIFELHRKAAFWGDAEAFRPERFGADAVKGVSDHYYPFGAGPRMCAGNNFAMYEMVMAMAIIFQDYEVRTPAATLDINPLISLKPGKVPITFIPRRKT